MNLTELLGAFWRSNRLPPPLPPSLNLRRELFYGAVRRDYLPACLRLARQLTETSSFVTSPASIICLEYALVSALFYRPLLENPQLPDSQLIAPTGGPPRNPYLQIDHFGGEMFSYIVRGLQAERPDHRLALSYFLEENDGWSDYGYVDHEKPHLRFVIDPLDGTSAPKRPKRTSCRHSRS